MHCTEIDYTLNALGRRGVDTFQFKPLEGEQRVGDIKISIKEMVYECVPN
jgi:hypothetical protein